MEIARNVQTWMIPKPILLSWIKTSHLWNQKISAEVKRCCFSPASCFCLISYHSISRSQLSHKSHHGRNCAHPIEEKHLLSHRDSGLNRQQWEGKKKAKWLRVAGLAGGRHGTRLNLSCWSGGLRMKPYSFVLVRCVCGHPACVGFSLALKQQQRTAFLCMYAWSVLLLIL